MVKVKHEAFTDGVLEFGEIESQFNANKKKTGEGFSSKGKLFYKQMSCRDSDLLQASSMGYVIDLKVKVSYRKEIRSTHKVKIGEHEYDIEKFDSDREVIYLYLQRVGVKREG